MAPIQRIRIALTGTWPGGPGVATFYGLNAAGMLPELKGLWAIYAQAMPSTVTIEYPTSGDVIDPLNGDLVGGWTAAGLAPDHGTQTGDYAAPIGAVVNWLTGGVLDGTHLRGRTFVVPLAGVSFDSMGQLATGTVSALQEVSTNKVATMSANFVVWHRPRTVPTPRKPVHAGGYDIVTSAHVSSSAAVLRSRRD
jgi:hypothetical protein